MDEAAQSFGQWLKRGRRACDFTQEELADRAGCAVATLRKIESGERRPSKEMAQRLAEALGVPESNWPRLVKFARAVYPDEVESTEPATAPARTESYRSLKTDVRAVANNLPAQLTSFVGRAREIPGLMQLLDSARLLTLTGAGGSGKTRLALETAKRLVQSGGHSFPDGIWLVDLARLADAELLPQAIASSLGVRDETQRSLLDQLTDHLRSRRLLLVLDNCEHLIGACAAVVDQFLRASAGVKILATSREPLAIDGEVTFYVPSLEVPDSRHLPPLEQTVEYEAIRLFTERARGVKQGFQVTADTALPVVEICERLDGMPLAIELAASRARVLPVSEIRSRLDDRFRLLTGGSRVGLPRHQTLRAAIEWSYDMLSEPEAALLRHLAVFAGGWTLDAAEVVWRGAIDGTHGNAADMLDVLTRLVDKSLVVTGWRDRPDRYGMLETLRQFALEQLELRGEALGARRRHAMYFVDLAERAEPMLMSREQRAWQVRLEYEHNNIQVALDWLMSSEADGERPKPMEDGLRLAGALWRYWEVRGSLPEGQARLERLLQSVGRDVEPSILARAHLGAGVCEFYRGNFALARSRYGTSIELYRQVGDQDALTRPLTYLAWMETYQGQFARARSLAEEAVRISREVGDMQAEAWATARLGIVAYWAGDPTKAVPLLERALALSRQLGDELGTGWWLLMLGNACLALGELDRSEELLEECIAVTRELGDRRDYGYARGSLTLVAALRGLQAQAYSQVRETLEVFSDLGDRFGLTLAMFVVVFATASSRPIMAIRAAGASIAMAEADGNVAPLGMMVQFDEVLNSLRAALGDEVFGSAWEQGRALPVEQVVAEALAVFDDISA